MHTCTGVLHFESMIALVPNLCMLLQVRDVGRDANWRKPENRMSHWDLLAWILRVSGHVNPIFSIPWIRSSIFKMDWLHAADHGATADFMGNTLWELQKKMVGRNKVVRVAALWQVTVGVNHTAKATTLRTNVASCTGGAWGFSLDLRCNVFPIQDPDGVREPRDRRQAPELDARDDQSREESSQVAIICGTMPSTCAHLEGSRLYVLLCCGPKRECHQSGLALAGPVLLRSVKELGALRDDPVQLQRRLRIAVRGLRDAACWCVDR